MAFQTKYTVTWMDVEGVTWDVYFQTDPWAGAVTALTPGVNPLNMTWNGGEKYQPIVGSSVDIQMVYESAIDTLYTEEAHITKVLVRQGGGTIWTGYVSPGQYFRQFNQPKHYATITATDGLGELKNIKFEDGSGDPYFYQETEIVTIANILQKTGLDLWTREFINIFEDTYDKAVTDSALAQTYIYPEMYWDEITDERSDCATVLSDILKKYGATIFQSESIWYIVRANSYTKDSITYRGFNYLGVYGNNGSFTTYVDVDADFKYIHADHELFKIAGAGSAEVTASPKMRENLLKNGSFDDFTWTGGTPYYWSESATAPNYNNVADPLAITIGSNESATFPADYVYTTQFLPKVKDLRVTLNYRAVYTGTPTHARVLVVLKYGGLYYTTAGTWSASAPPTSTGWQYDLIADGKASMGVGVFEELVIEPDPPYGATTGGWGPGSTLEVRLYQFYNETPGGVTTNYVQFRHVMLDVGFDNSLLENEIFTYENPATINNIHTKDVELCDAIIDGTTVTYDIFSGITTEAAEGAQTYDWGIIGDPTASAPIAEVLARQTVEGFRRSIDVIRGTFRTAYYYMARNAFRDSYFTDEYGYVKSFFPNGITFNAHRNEWSGEWIEVPSTYTDEAMEWDSHDCGGDATITGNSIEINSWANDAGSAGSFAYFDNYTAVAGETIRVVVTLTDDGSSALPAFYTGATGHGLTWGANYLEDYFSTGGAKSLYMYRNDYPFTFNLTCVVEVYSITGI